MCESPAPEPLPKYLEQRPGTKTVQYVVSRAIFERMVRSMSPLFEDGEWLMPEASLASAVVVQCIQDAVELARTRERDGLDPYPANTRGVEFWCEFLGIAPDIPAWALARIGVPVVDMDRGRSQA